MKSQPANNSRSTRGDTTTSSIAAIREWLAVISLVGISTMVCGCGVTGTGGNCGDTVCTAGETCVTCTTDCGSCRLATCGDLACNGAETCATCPNDCGTCNLPKCGYGGCEAPETCYNCPTDCDVCPDPVCGDGHCGGTEACNGCPQDCGSCPPTCPNGSCDAGETCQSCPQDCGGCSAVCNNGSCEAGENCATCPGDCGTCGAVCGNGTCETGETCSSCANDCGVCPGGCDAMCTHYNQVCGADPQCMTVCPQIPNGTRNCILQANTCTAIEACLGGTHECGDGNCDSDETESSCPADCATPQTCFFHWECTNSGWCYRQTASQESGVCKSHDMGTPCRYDHDCQYNFCHKTGLNINGVCSVPCAEDAQCPHGMACVMDEEHDAKGCKAN